MKFLTQVTWLIKFQVFDHILIGHFKISRQKIFPTFSHWDLSGLYFILNFLKWKVLWYSSFLESKDVVAAWVSIVVGVVIDDIIQFYSLSVEAKILSNLAKLNASNWLETRSRDLFWVRKFFSKISKNLRSVRIFKLILNENGQFSSRK